jgi:hypothetical protein
VQHIFHNLSFSIHSMCHTISALLFSSVTLILFMNNYSLSVAISGLDVSLLFVHYYFTGPSLHCPHLMSCTAMTWNSQHAWFTFTLVTHSCSTQQFHFDSSYWTFTTTFSSCSHSRSLSWVLSQLWVSAACGTIQKGASLGVCQRKACTGVPIPLIYVTLSFLSLLK